MVGTVGTLVHGTGTYRYLPILLILQALCILKFNLSSPYPSLPPPPIHNRHFITSEIGLDYRIRTSTELSTVGTGPSIKISHKSFPGPVSSPRVDHIAFSSIDGASFKSEKNLFRRDILSVFWQFMGKVIEKENIIITSTWFSKGTVPFHLVPRYLPTLQLSYNTVITVL